MWLSLSHLVKTKGQEGINDLVGWLVGWLAHRELVENTHSLFHPHKTTYCWANWSLENRLVQMIRYPHRFLHFKHAAVIVLPYLFCAIFTIWSTSRIFFTVRPCKILMIGRWSFPEKGLSGCTSFTPMIDPNPCCPQVEIVRNGRNVLVTNIAVFSQDVKKTSGDFWTIETNFHEVEPKSIVAFVGCTELVHRGSFVVAYDIYDSPLSIQFNSYRI